MRAAPFGVFAAGRPAEAARLVAVDGRVSHEGEGIYGGQAVAAGVAAAMVGSGLASVIAAALSVVPMDSWTARSLRRAVAAAQRPYPDRLTMERAVRSAVVIMRLSVDGPRAGGGGPGVRGVHGGARGLPYGGADRRQHGPGRRHDGCGGGGAGRGTAGESAIPPAWARAIGPVRGSCLPSMRGYHVLDIAELLTPDDAEAGTARERGGGREPSAVRDMASVAASFEPEQEERR